MWSDGEKWHTLSEFESDLLSEHTGLDEALIRACKTVVARMLVEGKETVYNEMAVQDAILFTYDDVR